VNTLRTTILLASILVVVFADSATSDAGGASPGGRITVVFRFDDYSETSNTEMEVRLIEAFRRHGVSCTFSIIPFICKGSAHDSREQGVVPLSAAKADILKKAVEAGAIELALHGYAHQTIRDTGGWTEFIGLAYDAQLAKVKKGKDFIEQLFAQPVTIFVPPWNSYDSNTTRALGDLGFTCLSAATFGIGEGPSSLKFLPATCDLLQLRQAVETARSRPEADRLVVTLFHTYDFTEANKTQGMMTYEDLVGLLDWLVSQPDVDVKTMEEVIDMGVDLSGARLTANGTFSQWPDYVPPFMPDLVGIPSGVYLSSASVKGLGGVKSGLYMGTALFYLAVVAVPAVIAFVLGQVVSARLRLLATFGKYAALVLLVAALAYGGRNMQLGYRGALVVLGLLGICIGIWAGTFAEARRHRGTPTA